MRPNPACNISGKHSRMQRKVPVRFSDSMDCQSASLVVPKGALSAWPALLTSTVIGPTAARAAATAVRTDSASATSATWQLRRTAPSSAATPSRSARERPSSVTSAPAPASVRAITAPIPRPAPVTRACNPVRGPVMRCSDGSDGLSRRPFKIGFQLPLAREIGIRPALFVKLLFRRSTQRPRGIRQMRPCQSTQVRPARRNDRIHVIRLEYIAHRDGRNTDLVANLVGERGLPHAAVDWLLVGHGLACGYIEYIRAGLLERTGNNQQIRLRKAALSPVAGGNSRRQRALSRPDLAHGAEDLHRESQPRGDVTAVFILTPIRERRQEAAQQVAMGHVKLQHIEACFETELRRADEFVPHCIHVGARHRPRNLADARDVRQSRGSPERPIARGKRVIHALPAELSRALAGGMADLQAKLGGGMTMHEIDDAPPRIALLGIPQAGTSGSYPSRGRTA